MKEVSRATRARQSKVKKPVAIAPRRNLNSAAGRALQDQLEQQLRGEEEEDDEGEEDGEAEPEEIKESDGGSGGHEVDLNAAHHPDDVSHHQLQLLAAANNLTNGPSPILSGTGADPSIHPALQALPSHGHFAMDPSSQDAVHHHHHHHHQQQQQPTPMTTHPDHGQSQSQPQPQHGHVVHHAARTAEQLARDSGYPDLTIDSALSKRLAKEGGVRHAVQRREEQTLNLKRRSNVEALLAHVSGTQTASPCKNCHKGHGPWSTCVVVDGQMCGSCANCWYNASGARCSFHEVRNPQTAHQPSVLANAATFNLPPMATAAQALSQGMMQSSPGAALSYDPQVKYIVDSAMVNARGGNQRQRHLLKIEAAAKTLALSIVEYEEYLQTDEGMADQDPQPGSTAPEASMTEPGEQ